VLLADEPTGALDTRSGAQVMELLGELHAERNLTIVLVTHDPQVAAFADRQVHMRDGLVVDVTQSASASAAVATAAAP
jgi:ABC-type lipoprotein export system ATPase subunit